MEPGTDNFVGGELFLFLILLPLNAFFAAAEFALISSHPAKIKSLAEKQKPRALTTLWLLEKLDYVLPAVQIGSSFTSLLIGWYGVRIISSFCSSVSSLGVGLSAEYSFFAGVVFFAIAFLLALLVHVIFVELAAKLVAIKEPERTLCSCSELLKLFVRIVLPLVCLVRVVTNFLLSFVGTRIPERSERFHTMSDISMIVSHSTETGVLDKNEEKMLKGVFGFSETIAREVMTPRTDLVSIEVNSTFAEVVAVIKETGISRLPVKGDEIDDIRGVLLAKDLFAYTCDSFGQPAKPFSVEALMRKPYFIPGTKPIDDLLNEFKHRKIHIAIVLDEHGGVDGVVTLEDLLEEIVGDIYDESDASEQVMMVLENGEMIVDGGALVADLNEWLSLSIPPGDYDTLAGFIFSSLGRMSAQGDQIALNKTGTFTAVGPEDDSFPEKKTAAEESKNEESDEASEELEVPSALFTVEKVDSNRIETVRIKIL